MKQYQIQGVVRMHTAHLCCFMCTTSAADTVSALSDWDKNRTLTGSAPGGIMGWGAAGIHNGF